MDYWYIFTLQLIYEVREGAGTIQLLTLKPEELNEKIIKKFKVLGIHIPNMKYVTFYCLVCQLYVCAQNEWHNRDKYHAMHECLSCTRAHLQ